MNNPTPISPPWRQSIPHFLHVSSRRHHASLDNLHGCRMHAAGGSFFTSTRGRACGSTTQPGCLQPARRAQPQHHYPHAAQRLSGKGQAGARTRSHSSHMSNTCLNRIRGVADQHSCSVHQPLPAFSPAHRPLPTTVSVLVSTPHALERRSPTLLSKRDLCRGGLSVASLSWKDVTFTAGLPRL